MPASFKNAGGKPALRVFREGLVDHAAPDVADQDVAFLDAGGFPRRHHQGVSDPLQQPAAIAAEQAQGHHAHLVRLLDSREDVAAVAAGGDGDQQVARARQRLDLAGEHPFIAEVVADGGERRGIGGQGDGGQGAAIGLETADHFGGDVLRVGGAAAIAAEKDAIAVAQAGDELRAEFLNAGFPRAQRVDRLQMGVEDG